MDYYKALEFINDINNWIPGLYVVGSVRRKEKIINDIDFITRRSIEDIVDDFSCYYGDKMTVIKEGKKYVRMEIKDSYYIKDKPLSVDVWTADNDTEYKFSKWLKNLDKGHAIGLMMKAREQGLKLSTKGLYDDNKPIPVKSFVELKKMLI